MSHLGRGLRKARKLIRILRRQAYFAALLNGVAAAVEHEHLRTYAVATVVDVGANRGQFSVLARRLFRNATIFAFEPLQRPYAVLERVFRGDPAVHLFKAAIGPVEEQLEMYVSAQDDSSSLLPITAEYVKTFPGTHLVGRETVNVAPLTSFLDLEFLSTHRPTMLKIDVQGFELKVLEGCVSLLSGIDLIYVECFFRQLYEGQTLADDVTLFLLGKGWRTIGVYNLEFDSKGQSIEGDFLFGRR